MSDTPRTEKIRAEINACARSSEAAFHAMLHHARQLELELAWMRAARDAVRATRNLEAAMAYVNAKTGDVCDG